MASNGRGIDVRGAFVAYDARLLNAARAVGLQVHFPV